jgi:hypothetical protein
VVLRDVTPARDAPAHVDAEALERALRARLLATGLFADDDASPAAPPAVTRVEIQIALDGAEIEQKGVARARVRLHLETRPADAPGALVETIEATGEQTYDIPPRAPAKGAGKGAPPAPPKEPLYEGLVQRVAGDLLADVVARSRVAHGGPDAIHAALAADGGTLRLEAIRAVGEQHVSAEVPRLLALLDDPEETTRDAALGALIALGDRRAVTALTRSRSLRDRRELGKIIEALSALGGQEADDYLAFVASSHDDEDIRAQATAARARLLRRADSGAKSP